MVKNKSDKKIAVKKTPAKKAISKKTTAKKTPAKKILIVYYSRTGITKKVALNLNIALSCDSEEIIDTKDRSGAMGYLGAGKDATLKKLTTILQPTKDVKDYDLIIIGTPVWAFTMSSAILTYIRKNKDRFDDKKEIALFCTLGGSGAKKTFDDLEKECEKKAIAKLDLTENEVRNNLYFDKLSKFAETIKNTMQKR